MNCKMIVLLLFVLCVSFSCAGSPGTVETESPSANQTTPQSQKTSEEPQVSKTPIPPDSPFAKIKEGMGQKQVTEILGQPKDQEVYNTGKQWIPFYVGSDIMRTVYYYKGLGQIHFTGGRVMEVIYDPTEDGYR